MKFSWKILPLAALFVLGLAILVPTGTTRPTAVSAAAGDITISKVANGPDAGSKLFGFNISSSVPACTASFSLNGGSSSTFNGCTTAGDYTVSEVATAGWSLTNVVCSVSGGASFNTSSTGVVIHQTATGVVSCTFTNTQAGSPTPTVTATVGTATATATTTGTVVPTATSTSTVGTASQAVLTATSTSLGCSSSTFVTALVKDANGAAVPGVAVNFSATRGTVTSTVTTDGNGNALAVYTAPATGNQAATVTATGSSFTGTTSITINCNAGVVPTTAPPAAPPAAPPVAAAPSQVTPPRTGDAGLADTNRWQTYVGFGLIAASLLGSLAVVRVRS